MGISIRIVNADAAARVDYERVFHSFRALNAHLRAAAEGMVWTQDLRVWISIEHASGRRFGATMLLDPHGETTPDALGATRTICRALEGEAKRRGPAPLYWRFRWWSEHLERAI